MSTENRPFGLCMTLAGALVSTCLSKIQESLPALASSTTSYSVQVRTITAASTLAAASTASTAATQSVWFTAPATERHSSITCAVQLAGLRVSRSVQILTLFLARFGEREWAAGEQPWW